VRCFKAKSWALFLFAFTRNASLTPPDNKGTPQSAGTIETKAHFHTIFVLDREGVHEDSSSRWLRKMYLVDISVPSHKIAGQALPLGVIERRAAIMSFNLDTVLRRRYVTIVRNRACSGFVEGAYSLLSDHSVRMDFVRHQQAVTCNCARTSHRNGGDGRVSLPAREAGVAVLTPVSERTSEHSNEQSANRSDGHYYRHPRPRCWIVWPPKLKPKHRGSQNAAGRAQNCGPPSATEKRCAGCRSNEDQTGGYQ
jgi:hypothetical protein